MKNLRDHKLSPMNMGVFMIKSQKERQRGMENSAAEEFSIPENIVPVCLLVMGYAADDAIPAPGHLRKRPIQETVIRL